MTDKYKPRSKEFGGFSREQFFGGLEYYHKLFLAGLMTLKDWKNLRQTPTKLDTCGFWTWGSVYWLADTPTAEIQTTFSNLGIPVSGIDILLGQLVDPKKSELEVGNEGIEIEDID